MKKPILFILLFLFAVTGVSAQEVSLKGKPVNITESFLYFDQIFDDTAKYTFFRLPEHLAVNRLHGSVGKWVEENWGLWKNSAIRKNLIDSGFQYPDEMSALLLRAYHRHLNGKPLKTGEEAKKYKTDVDDYRTQKELLQHFPIGDTIAVTVGASGGGGFGFDFIRLKGEAVVKGYRDEKILVTILKLEKKKKFRPERKPGQNYLVSPYFCNLIPPKDWSVKSR